MPRSPYSSKLPLPLSCAKLRLIRSPKLLGILRKLTLLCIFFSPLRPPAPPGMAVTGLDAGTPASPSASPTLPSLGLRRPANGGVGGGLRGAANIQRSASTPAPSTTPDTDPAEEGADATEAVGDVGLTQHGQLGTPVVGRAHIASGLGVASSKMGLAVGGRAHMGALGSEGRIEKMDCRQPGRFHIGAPGWVLVSA
jgi:hypothetical protein